MAIEDAVGTGADQSTDDEELSLRDTLAAAFEEAGQEPAQSISRERDESGRFAGKPAQGEPNTEQAPAPAAAATDADPAAAQKASDPEVPPPASWSAEAKAEWANLTPKARAIIAAREAEVHKGFTRLDEERNLGKTMQGVLTPYMATINALGATPAQAVQSLLNADHVLRNGAPAQKTQLLAQLAHQFGVDLSPLAANAPPPDATIQALQQQVHELTAFINGQQRSAQQTAQQSLASEIEAFKANKPHFDTLRTAMAALMESGQASGLQDAYDQAFRAHPTTSQLWLDGEVAKRASTQVDPAKARVARAKSAAVSVTGSPGATGAPPRATQPDLRSELAAQFQAAGFRI